MELKKIDIRNFKKIRNAELELSKINFLVGGNNSGKSSILQAIHCSVTAAQSQVANNGAKVFLRRIENTANYYSILILCEVFTSTNHNST